MRGKRIYIAVLGACILHYIQAFVVFPPRIPFSSLKCSSRQPIGEEYTVAVVGDLHLDPRNMIEHFEARDHILNCFKHSKSNNNNYVVSLGDFGCSQPVDDSNELFSGTTPCFQLARSYLDSFNVSCEAIVGNHDLEGIDEFATDEDNLSRLLQVFDKPRPYFQRLIADKTLIVGLSTARFRNALYSSHEVFIDDDQIQWFEDLVKACAAEHGWKVFVFTHAPPTGSGLRVLQENHVVNGCCWLNHSHRSRKRFIDFVRNNRCIKGWFSGHFHLGQDYEDSISAPMGANRGSCVFSQTGVISSNATRDGQRQSRLIRGNKDGFKIFTIDHCNNGEIRLDATVAFDAKSHESIVYSTPHEHFSTEKWFSVYSPSVDDGFYIPNGLTEPIVGKQDITCWWHMASGRVLGIQNGLMLEYDSATLAPLGLVLSRDELLGKRLVVIDVKGVNNDGAQIEKKEQALLLYDEDNFVYVVQPNEDGSYWRKIVRNKVIRQKEKRRERCAHDYAVSNLGKESNMVKVKSTWGPYTSNSGHAKIGKLK